MGKLKYEERIKEHLFLPEDQNNYLLSNLSLEDDVASKIKPGPLLDMKNVMAKHAKSDWYAQRPLLVPVSRLNESLSSLHGLAPSLRVKFPTEALFRSVLGPEVQDNLGYESFEPFPLPEEVDILGGTDKGSAPHRLTIT